MQIMEKFLIKPKDAHIAVKTTARDRFQSNLTGTLHEDGNLFCSTCNVALDHTRKSSIDKHLKSATHIQRAKRSETMDKQQTLKTSLHCQTAVQVFPRVHSAHDYITLLYCFDLKVLLFLFIKGMFSA